MSRPQTLDPNQFVRHWPNPQPQQPGQPVEQSGPIRYGQLHAPLLPDEYPNRDPEIPAVISPLVRREIPAPGEVAGAEPATTQNAVASTGPSTQPAPGVPGGYQVVGTVLVRVNGTAIFADKVLATLDRELAAEARKFGPDQFRRAARQDIEQKLQELIFSQLEVEQAQKSLSDDSKGQARGYAQMWRRQQITAASGSEAVARQRALEAGQSLDEQVEEQYHTALVQIYYSQRVAPKIHVTAADMRRYYAEHLNDEFNKPAEAQVRLIRIDWGRAGGKEAAMAKVDEILKDLQGGSSFGQEASKFNDNPEWLAKGGDVGWVQKGSLRWDEVDEAVWKLQRGQYTDQPILVDGASANPVYFLVEVDQRKGGVAQPFDNPIVQKTIQEKLFSQQFTVLREHERMELISQAVAFREPLGVETTVDMAMQRYPVWANAR
jgi:hypothetical protein